MIQRRTLAYCAAAFVVGGAYVLLIEASTRLAGGGGRAMAEWHIAPCEEKP